MNNPVKQHPRTLTARHWLAGLVALLFLNASLTFNNVWPTPAIWPDARLATELVWFWVFLFLVTRFAGTVQPWLVRVCAIAFTGLIIGRYIDVTAPALFGRPLNLYWDGLQLPRFLSVASQSFQGWQLALMGMAIVAGLYAVYRLVRAAIQTLSRPFLPALVHQPLVILVTVAAAGVSLANHAGVQATWPYVSRPVTPTYARQADLLLTAFLPSRLEKVLPPSPAFDTNVDGLGRADMTLMFLESYGAVTYDDPAIASRLRGLRGGLVDAAQASGRQVFSAYVKAATFGGASELSHLSLLSGIDLTDPLRHDLLLTTRRPTLVSLLKRYGYQVFGLYPALSWDWPEKSFYEFDVFIDGPALRYRGPKFGLWWIPDQYTIAQFENMHPVTRQGQPRLLFFSTITSHAPFRPTPPYQPDWQRVISADPYDAREADAAMADTPDWNDMSGYTDTIVYTFRWLNDYVARPRARPEMLVIIGDHQPVGKVTGENARWDVPVHIVTADPAVASRLQQAGFSPGVTPARGSLGGMHDLTAVLTGVLHRDAAELPQAANKQWSAQQASDR